MAAEIIKLRESSQTRTVGRWEDTTFEDLAAVYQAYMDTIAIAPVQFGDFVQIYNIGRESR